MKIIITTTEHPYGDREKLIVNVDGIVVSELTISADCPEDNTVYRLGLPSIIEQIVKAIKPDAEVEHESRPETEDDFS